MAPELVALVKHDCPVCDSVLPALDAAGVRVVSQSTPEETQAQAQRLGLAHVPEIDTDLALSEQLDPDAVPAVVLLDGEREEGRVEGLQRARLIELAAQAGATLDLDGLPEMRPGCASLTRDPEVAARLAARAARRDGRLRAREVVIGELEDVHEALFARGVTDGLPVVPPTPERVVRMLEGTSRDPQDLVGIVPPYDGRATVEKVAINAVMAGCAAEHLPVVLAAVNAACKPEFAWHGLIATTHPAGPVVIAFDTDVGINTAGNVLGQGTRANSTIGRALQLVGRNVGGGRPQVEDRAAHGQPGKVGLCFAERSEGNPWPSPYDAPTVLLMALEAPRIVVDQLAREPEGLAASLAPALESVAHPRQRLAWDALLVVGPEHARVFGEAGWSREQLRQRLFELTTSPAGDLVRGAGGSPEGIERKWVSDPDMPVAKFASPDRIQIVHAGGDAGLFSMVFGSWAAGEIGSAPVTEEVSTWA